MLSPESRDHATALRTLLNDGELAALGPVELATDVTFPFEVAARIALADLGHLDDLTSRARYVASERWHRLAADLEALYDLAVPGR